MSTIMTGSRIEVSPATESRHPPHMLRRLDEHLFQRSALFAVLIM
jgi:hypothetical protein